MTDEFEKFISDCVEKYEIERAFKRNRYQPKQTCTAEFLLSEVKYADTLNEEELAAFKEYRHYVLKYISALKKEYFSAGYLYAGSDESHVNKKGQNN